MVNHCNRSAYHFIRGYRVAGKPDKEKTRRLLHILYHRYHMAAVWHCHRKHQSLDAWINLHDNRPWPQERVEKEQSTLVRPHRRRKKIQAHYYNRTDHCVCSLDCGLLHSFERDCLK